MKKVTDAEILKAIELGKSLNGAARLCGLSYNALYERIRPLIKDGLVKATRPRGRKLRKYKLTRAGRALLRGEAPVKGHPGEEQPLANHTRPSPAPGPGSKNWPLTGGFSPPFEAIPLPQGSLLGQLADLAPSALHACLLRLAVAGVISRKAQLERGTVSTGFPSLILVGPPGVGKTGLARLLFRLFSLDEATGLKYLPISSPGEITVRRIGSEREPRASWLWRLPLVCLDEISLAEKPIRDAIFSYLLGERSIVVEGEPIELKPFVLATYNPRQGALILPEGVERRAVIADLEGLKTERYAIMDKLRALSTRDLPRLDLSELAARVEVDYREEDGAYLASLYRPLLKEDSERLPTDELPLWHLWEGYRSLGLGPKEAAGLVIADVATCLETRELVVRDWQARLQAAYQGQEYRPPPPVEVDQERLREIEAKAEQRRREAEELRVRELEARLERKEHIAALLALIDESEREIRALPELACQMFKTALKRRGVVLTGWQSEIEAQVRRQVAICQWSAKLRAIREEAKRRLSDAEIEALADHVKEIHGEIAAYKAHLAENCERLAAAQAERARRNQLAAAPPALQPHLRVGLPRRTLFTWSKRSAYSREDVERIERAWEEFTGTGKTPEELAREFGASVRKLPPVRWPPGA